MLAKGRWELTRSLKGLSSLVRFAERRNLVSERVPSHFKRSPLSDPEEKVVVTSMKGVLLRILESERYSSVAPDEQCKLIPTCQ